MKQTNINIDEIKRFPTVTNPIKADDLHTPQAYAYTLRRAIVTDCNDRQRAELVTLLEGKDTAEGVTFNNTQLNRDRLHIWQNQESRRERAAILGEGWQYSGNLNDGTPHANPGDEITCVDGTTGICTKASPEIVCIEFETADGRALTVAGYFFRKERTSLQDTREITEQREQNDACISSAESRRDKANGQITEAEGVKVGDKVKHVWSDEVATVTAIRKAYWDASAGEVWLFTLDYGKDTRGEWKTVLGPFKMDLNGKEFRREAFTLYEPSEITEQREQNDACISSAESRRDKANGQIRAAAVVREQQDRPGHVNTSWATDYTPEDFEKLTSRYEIADEDRDIMGRRFHTGEGLWTVDVFVSDYAGNEAHALIYLLTGEGEVRANVLSLDHLRQTLTEAKGWTRTA